MRNAIIWVAVGLLGALACQYKPPVDPNATDKPEVYEGKFFTGPNGDPHWTVVHCVNELSDCYHQASLACPSGYDKEDSQDSVTSSSTTKSHAGAFGGNGWAAAHGHSNTSTYESHQIQMLIHCKDQNAASPSATPALEAGPPSTQGDGGGPMTPQ